MPKISVIFPMYNVAAYLRDSLLSVLGQSYTDYELVAVNDGSTDNTVDLFREIVGEYTGACTVRLLEKPNGGLADARNVGLDAAEGEWVVFIDSDDLMHPDFLQTLAADAERFQTELSAATLKRVGADTLKDFEPTVGGEAVEREALMTMLLSRQSYEIHCCSLLIKKALLEKNNIRFNAQIRFSVDQAFMWQVIDAADSISINRSPLYHYYIRSGSIMTATKREHLLSGAAYFAETARSLRHLPFDSEILINRWKCGIMHSVAKLLPFEEYMEVKNELGLSYRACLKIPVRSVRLLSAIGMVSERLLYRIYVKH